MELSTVDMIYTRYKWVILSATCNLFWMQVRYQHPSPQIWTRNMDCKPKNLALITSDCGSMARIQLGIAALMQIMAFSFGLLAERLNDFENHRLQSDWEHALIVKNFIFEFVNNYFVKDPTIRHESLVL